MTTAYCILTYMKKIGTDFPAYVFNKHKIENRQQCSLKSI